jgi:beta-mannosidase
MSIEGIDNFFENNYFDLLPGQKVTVKVFTALPLSQFSNQLKITSLVGGYSKG